MYRAGVANLLDKWAKIKIKMSWGPKISSKKTQWAKKSIFKGIYNTVHAEKVQNKTCRAIHKASAGHIWPAGPGLATPDLDDSCHTLLAHVSMENKTLKKVFERQISPIGSKSLDRNVFGIECQTRNA